jgi:hypothetical protein
MKCPVNNEITDHTPHCEFREHGDRRCYNYRRRCATDERLQWLNIRW